MHGFHASSSLFCYVINVEQISGIHWWYKTASHAAELTAGFYNSCNRDGYTAITAMLKKHGAVLNFASAELYILGQHEAPPEVLGNPEGLAWQVSIKYLKPLPQLHIYLWKKNYVFCLLFSISFVRGVKVGEFLK